MDQAPFEADACEDDLDDLPIIDKSLLKRFEKIGDGRTSEVYRGTYGGVEVAVKEMKEFASMKPKDRMNLAREIDILRRVAHDHLVGFIGIMESAGKIRVITDFCRGGDLFDLLHNSGLNLAWTQKTRIGTDVASAMAYLHGYDPPIIHRDLKSLNLILAAPVRKQTDTPYIKVTDFGQARMMDFCVNMTQNAGTYHWMAPEVFTMSHYDSKVDVYSFAMVLYELLCQAIPFADIKAEMVGMAVLQGKRPDLAMVPEDCPAYLQQMMTSCWATAPEDRPTFSTIFEWFVSEGSAAAGSG
mmetsp:Transcript_43477/g.86392  ORF Transcript_43477/g.86392 Transcript_43477/m.86392 type:complete len:299 (-) Transcript_43477:81-977(-)